MIVGERTRVADMERLISSVGTDLLERVDLFDLYLNKEKSQRSMAFRLVFASPERTLTAKEIDMIMQEITATLEKEDNIEIKK